MLTHDEKTPRRDEDVIFYILEIRYRRENGKPLQKVSRNPIKTTETIPCTGNMSETATASYDFSLNKY